MGMHQIRNGQRPAKNKRTPQNNQQSKKGELKITESNRKVIEKEQEEFNRQIRIKKYQQNKQMQNKQKINTANKEIPTTIQLSRELTK